jgi:hypothetical protein
VPIANFCIFAAHLVRAVFARDDQKENRIMADITIAGVMRAGAYSPNQIGNDTAIFNLVAG